jgi:hypothetical protein
MRSWNSLSAKRPPPTTIACSDVAGRHDLEAFARDHLKRSLAAPGSNPKTKCQNGLRRNRDEGRSWACRLVMIILSRPPASRWIKEPLRLKFQLSGDHVRRGLGPSAPTISCNRREPGINSASAQACPTSPERSRALGSRGVALLRATRHFINGQTARMFLHTHRLARVPITSCAVVLVGKFTGDYRGIRCCLASSHPPCGGGSERAAANGRDNKPGHDCE